MFKLPAGNYDEQGNWQSFKSCLVHCGDMCDCGPPFGVHHIDPGNKELSLLKEKRNALMRDAELAAHEYCNALGMDDMKEREAAFDIKENLHRAAVYGL